MQNTRWAMIFRGLALICAVMLAGSYISCQSQKASQSAGKQVGDTKQSEDSQANASTEGPEKNDPSEPHKFEPKFDLNKALSKSSPIYSDDLVGDGDRDKGNSGGGQVGGDDQE